jgi:hypothetical protein
MERLKEFKNSLEIERPVQWNDLPDIGLYKDQVVTYLKRQLINLDQEGQLTPAMISNYIKDKLLPKADGKKYNKEHIAILTEISLLKQVLQVKDISFLLPSKAEQEDKKKFYTWFAGTLDESLKNLADKLETSPQDVDIRELALWFAIESYSNKLVCESLIGFLRNEEGEGK